MSFEDNIEQKLDEFQARGTIAVVFDATGSIIYERSWGYADCELQSRLNKETIMGIASMSKSFVALGIMQLVEKNILNLDSFVSEYLPTLKGGQQEKIKLKHLLYHSGGFPQLHRTTVYEVLEEMGRKAPSDVRYLQDISKDVDVAAAGLDKIMVLLNGVTVFAGEPGEAFVYSNDSYGLLTELIRKYGGEDSFAEYIEKNIFAPLGMERSTYQFIFPEDEKNMTTLYRRADDVETKESPTAETPYIATHDFYDNAYVLMGGGNVKSTINNLIPYVCFYLNLDAEPKVLSQILKEEMIQPRIQTAETESYGYGLFEYQNDFGRCYGHSGSLTGVSSNMMWSYEHQKGAIVLSNTTNVPAKEIATMLLAEFCQ